MISPPSVRRRPICFLLSSALVSCQAVPLQSSEPSTLDTSESSTLDPHSRPLRVSVVEENGTPISDAWVGLGPPDGNMVLPLCKTNEQGIAFVKGRCATKYRLIVSWRPHLAYSVSDGAQEVQAPRGARTGGVVVIQHRPREQEGFCVSVRFNDNDEELSPGPVRCPAPVTFQNVERRE